MIPYYIQDNLQTGFGYYPVMIGSIILTLGILLSFTFILNILISQDEIIPVTRQNVGVHYKNKENVERIE